MALVNIHIYQSTMTHESRIFKITKSLAVAGIFDKIVIVGKWEEGLSRDEQIDDIRSCRRLPTWFRTTGSGTLRKLLLTTEWMVRVYREAVRLRPNCVNCHSLIVLPLGVALKLRTGCRLIYDTHELETETSVSIGMRKWIAKLSERTLIGMADWIFVVGDEIATWYRSAYPGRNVSVIRNVPAAPRGDVHRSHAIRSCFGINEHEMLFLYQGLIDKGRGIELLCRIFSRLPMDKHIVFLGYGDLLEVVEDAARRNPNIHYHPAVKPDEVPLYTGEADVGLSLIENVSLSYYHSLPNKIFEYINCGVPVIVSDFPEMGSIVDTHRIGWKSELIEDHIQQLIEGITPEQVAEIRPAVLACRGFFSWEKEEPLLLTVYRDLFPSVSSSDNSSRFAA